MVANRLVSYLGIDQKQIVYRRHIVMNTKTVYHYDKDKVFDKLSTAYESPREPGVFPLPANCTWTEPPVLEKPFVAVWNGTEWVATEDHRKHIDETGTYAGGTPFWLPEDDYKVEARYMKELGSLPDGAVLVKPEKPQSAIRKDEIERELAGIKEWLRDHDYIGTKIATGRASAFDYAEVIAEMTAKADEVNKLEEELATL